MEALEEIPEHHSPEVEAPFGDIVAGMVQQEAVEPAPLPQVAMALPSAIVWAAMEATVRPIPSQVPASPTQAAVEVVASTTSVVGPVLAQVAQAEPVTAG